jgi:hypothetical protein
MNGMLCVKDLQRKLKCLKNNNENITFYESEVWRFNKNTSKTVLAVEMAF